MYRDSDTKAPLDDGALSSRYADYLDSQASIVRLDYEAWLKSEVDEGYIEVFDTK